MSTNSGGVLMRVSQYPVCKRPVVGLLACAFLALAMLFATSQASAESPVYSNPKTNVFFRYGKGPVLVSEGYTNIWQIYRHGKFVNTRSIRFGYLNTLGNERGEEVGVFLRLVPYERVIGIETEYQLDNGTQIPFKWDGKGLLPIRRHFGKHKAALEYVDVGVHSPKLPDQSEEPEYTGMH